jgi:hypothetical protein
VTHVHCCRGENVDKFKISKRDRYCLQRKIAGDVLLKLHQVMGVSRVVLAISARVVLTYVIKYYLRVNSRVVTYSYSFALENLDFFLV